MMRNLVLFVFIIFSALQSQAESLQDIFKAALLSDPVLGSADFISKSYKGDKNEKCGALFPQVTASAGYTDFDQNKPGTILGSSSANTNSSIDGTQSKVGVSLNQTIFDLEKLSSCRAGYMEMNRGNAQYQLELENLVSRVVKAYVNVLAAKSRVAEANGAVDLYNAVLKDAERRYSSSRTISIKDLELVKSKLASAQSYKIIADNELVMAKLELSDLSGGEFNESNIQSFSEEILLAKPPSLDPEYWATIATEHNLQIIENSFDKKLQKYKLKQERAKRFPKIEAYANHTNFDNDITLSTSSSDGSFDVQSIGVTATWKFFTGGSTNGGVYSAKNRYKSASLLHQDLIRKTRNTARKSVLNLKAAIANIEASKANLKFVETKLKDLKRGVNAGTSTKTDLLEAKHNLLEARYQFDKSHYEYISAMVGFWKAIGSLSPKSIDEVSGWIISTNAPDELEDELQESQLNESSSFKDSMSSFGDTIAKYTDSFLEEIRNLYKI